MRGEKGITVSRAASNKKSVSWRNQGSFFFETRSLTYAAEKSEEDQSVSEFKGVGFSSEIIIDFGSCSGGVLGMN